MMKCCCSILAKHIKDTVFVPNMTKNDCRNNIIIVIIFHRYIILRPHSVFHEF